MNRICEEKTVTSEGVESVLTEEAFVLAAKEVIYLASCVVNGELPDRDRAAGMNLHHLFAVAHAHQMTAITAIALEKAGVKDEAFTQAKGKAIRKNASLDIDRSALFARLEEEKIWYMPLKGAVLAGYYPAFGMRQMSDNDILIDKSRAKDVKEIMKSLGYEVEAFGKGVHDEYVKKPVCFFVIHRALFNQNEKRLYEYYKDVEARLIKAEGTFERHFSIEDFYVYLLAHDYRHYSDSGTGLRSLLDIYLFWRKNGQRLDMNYTENQLATLGILDFEKQSRGLALRLFSGKELSEREEELLRYYILSGAHGSMLNEMKKQGRWQFFWKNLFLPFDRMTIQYPILRKLPFLLPVCWIMRFFRRLTRTPERIGQKLRYLLLYKEKEE